MTASRLLALGICAFQMVFAQRVGVPTSDLDKMSVDELFSVEVTSVGRKAQQLAKAPAAVFVLTAADIRRSGATSIPEALQLVPGLTVLSLDGRSWTVSARGSARLYSDKILVMIDGRSLYTPFFSGVIWDAVDVMLQDVERIEVVRGPGAVMWGPNAVNGVINIITKSARDSKGGQSAVASGNQLKSLVEARWGAAPSEKLAWRTWGKFDYLTPAHGTPGEYVFAGIGTYQSPPIRNLDSAGVRMGFRMDGQATSRDQWTVEGDLFKRDRQDSVPVPVLYPLVVIQKAAHSDYEGGDLQAKWTHTQSAGNERTLQFSFDRTGIDYSNVAGTLNNLRFNFESRQQTGDRNEVYWGGGYQFYWDETASDRWIQYLPRDATYHVGDVVLRDELQLVPGRWTASAGVRLDYSSYRQLEYQPSIRLLYTPDARHSAWLAVSRAVRTPNRLDRDFDEFAGQALMSGYPVQLGMYGSKSMRSEVERSIEAGYRFQAGQRWSVDASVFWSDYGRLRAVEGSNSVIVTLIDGQPTLTATVNTCNCGAARSYGGEIWGTWQVRSRWRLSPSYSYLRENRWLPSAVSHTYFWDGTPASLRHQGVLRSEHDLARNVQFDLTLRPRSGDHDLFHLPGALFVDARLAWKAVRGGELSVTVRNLTDRNVLAGYPELTVAALPLRRTFVMQWAQRF